MPIEKISAAITRTTHSRRSGRLPLGRLLPGLAACLMPGLIAANSALAQATFTLPVAPVAQSSQSAQNSNSSDPSAATLSVPTTSSLFNPYYGSVVSAPARPEVIKLSLQDAVRLGLENNLGMVYARQNELQQHAQTLELLNVLLPNIDVTGSHSLHQFDLATEGFRPGLFSVLGPILGIPASANIPLVVKVNETQAQANLSQYLFNLAGYDAVRAFQHSEKSARLNSAATRGFTTLNVGTAYLRAVAAQSQVDYAQSLLKTDEAVLYQSVQLHKAGITANLDELRSRVQYQTQQQSVIAAENSLAKAKIALNRHIGLAPEQQIAISDVSPFADLDVMAPEEANRRALSERQDYQAILEQLRVAEYERKAATHERFPTVSFSGNYGITGVTGLVYHDTWTATGTLNVPIFQEAKFRSDRDTAEYQLQNLRTQIANLRGQIDQQVRNSMIDVRTAQEVVHVARSNVDLANTELSQSIDRFRAGVEDNLPVTQAQSTLAQAQNQYVTAVFQLNQARLGFARNLGLLHTEFDTTLPGGRPAGIFSDSAAALPITGH
jgi:outer membrane protein TolC